MSSNADDTTRNVSYPADWSKTLRWITVVALLIGGVFALSLLGNVLSLTVYSLLLAYVLYLPIQWLTRRTPLKYGASLAVVFVVYLVLLVVLLLLVVPSLLSSALNLVDGVAAQVQEWGAYLLDDGARATVWDPLGNLMEERITTEDVEQFANQIASLISVALQAVGSLGSAIVTTIAVHLFAIFALIELPQLVRAALSGLPSAHRREVAILVGNAWQRWNRYIVAMVVFALLVGVLNGLQIALLGIGGAIVVGIVAGLFAFIPVIGGFITVFAVAIVALVQGSSYIPLPPLGLALLVVAINLVISLILSQIVFPKMIGDAMSLPVVLIIVGVGIAGALFGPMGMILIAPVLSLLVDLVVFMLAKIRGGDPFPGASEPVFFERMF